MSGRILIRALSWRSGAVCGGERGAGRRLPRRDSGWPAYANGYYAANYPANYGAGAAYYVRRPVTAGYAVAPGAVTYVPARVAYANPTYYAAYGRSPTVYRRFLLPDMLGRGQLRADGGLLCAGDRKLCSREFVCRYTRRDGLGR